MIDDDRLLDVVGIAVAGIVVVAVAVLVLAGATAPSRQPVAPPDVDWTIERVAVAQVEITHAGGEPVNASNLVVSIAGVERSPGRDDVLREGDSLTVSARSGQHVQLFWVGGRDERALLAEWEAP